MPECSTFQSPSKGASIIKGAGIQLEGRVIQLVKIRQFFSKQDSSISHSFDKSSFEIRKRKWRLKLCR